MSGLALELANVLDDLADALDCLKRYGEAGQWDWPELRDESKLLLDQHAEIERLTQEVRDLRSLAAGMQDAADSMRADIELLHHDVAHLLELLAIIHRDGGQYVAQHGIEKACKDAGAQVSTWLETINNADALCDVARIAEREACANLCEDAFDKYPKDDNRAFGALYCAGIIRIRSSTNHHINRYDR